MPKASIFEQVRDALTPEGSLPEDFVLPDDTTPASEEAAVSEEPGRIRLAPGAEDGIRIYHFGVTPVPDIAKDVARILRKDCKKAGAKPNPRLAELVTTYTALSLMDDLIDELDRDMRGVILSNFSDYACRLAFDSSGKEMIKLGIALMGMLVTEGEDEITNDLLTLAAYDEFTLYVVIALQNRTDTDNLVFRIARSVRGWGKIHAVERLEPSTPEIREWILREGLRNYVSNSYLALSVAEKGRLIDVLRAESIDDEELFASVCEIMEALVDESSVTGISVYEDREEALTHFLRHAAMRPQSETILRAVRGIEGKIDTLLLSTKESIQSHIRDILES